MFNNSLKKELKYYKEENERITIIKDNEILNSEIERDFLKAQYDSKENILRNELQMEIDKNTSSYKKEINSLNIEISTVKKENEILKNAFENMWFDVKDTKEILNKLVDGLIAKNWINIIKTK